MHVYLFNVPVLGRDLWWVIDTNMINLYYRSLKISKIKNLKGWLFVKDYFLNAFF